MPKTTKDFAEVIRRRLAVDSDLSEQVDAEQLNANIAVQIFEARRKAEMSQTELANRIGTKQSVISRLEDCDYDAHSLSMLKKIAKATGMKLRVEIYQEQDPCAVEPKQTVYCESEIVDWPSSKSALAPKMEVLVDSENTPVSTAG